MTVERNQPAVPADTPFRSGETIDLWNQVATFDPTIRPRPGYLPALERKQVLPQPFSRRRLFQGMADGEVRLLTGLQLLADEHARSNPAGALVRVLSEAFPKTETASVLTGRSQRRRNLDVADLMARWEQRRSLVSVTDLHIRGTALEEVIDTAVLSDFNILRKGSDDMAWHEMMTMVVSAKGHVTDSHSDDPDGSNHCFVGRKLWLVWDTFEGRAHGLQDVERDYVADRARFNLHAFLGLRSSRWFVITPGMTLFLPGNLTHKVITLEHYLGVGSFYVSLPNCVRTVSRWTIHGPLWLVQDKQFEKAGLVAEIARVATSLIGQVRHSGPEAGRVWGLPFLRQSVRAWEAAVPAGTRATLLKDPVFAALVNEARGRGHRQEARRPELESISNLSGAP